MQRMRMSRIPSGCAAHVGVATHLGYERHVASVSFHDPGSTHARHAVTKCTQVLVGVAIVQAPELRPHANATSASIVPTQIATPHVFRTSPEGARLIAPKSLHSTPLPSHREISDAEMLVGARHGRQVRHAAQQRHGMHFEKTNLHADMDCACVYEYDQIYAPPCRCLFPPRMEWPPRGRTGTPISGSESMRGRHAAEWVSWGIDAACRPTYLGSPHYPRVEARGHTKVGACSLHLRHLHADLGGEFGVSAKPLLPPHTCTR